MSAVDPKLLAELRVIFERTRKDALTFAVLTVLVTPFFLALTALAAFFALALAGGDALVIASGAGAYGFVTLFLVVSLVTVWGAGRERPWLGATLVAAAGAIAVLGSALGDVLHLALFGGVAFGALAVLGRAYEPRDDYDLGGIHGDPFTLRDDADRLHLGAGCLMAIPTMVLGAYHEVFASSWLWRGVGDDRVSAAASVLLGAKRGDVVAVIRTLGFERRQVLALLVRAELARVHRDKITLTERGRELLA